jgi:hypothetical protein
MKNRLRFKHPLFNTYHFNSISRHGQVSRRSRIINFCFDFTGEIRFYSLEEPKQITGQYR